MPLSPLAAAPSQNSLSPRTSAEVQNGNGANGYSISSPAGAAVVVQPPPTQELITHLAALLVQHAICSAEEEAEIIAEAAISDAIAAGADRSTEEGRRSVATTTTIVDQAAEEYALFLELCGSALEEYVDLSSPSSLVKGKNHHNDVEFTGKGLVRVAVIRCTNTNKQRHDAAAAASLSSSPWSSSKEEEEEEAGGRSKDDADDDDAEFPQEEEEDYIGHGDCELCERTMTLTRHHLIPRSTWPRLYKRMSFAIDQERKNRFKKGGDGHQQPSSMDILREHYRDLFDALHSSIGEPLDAHGNFVVSGGDVGKRQENDNDDQVRLMKKKHTSRSHTEVIRQYLQRTCDICRQCHSMVHRLHPDNMELAERYNTVEKLLEDEDVVRFCRWANKQKVVGHGGGLKYRS